jgi:hypothetical protein
MSRIPLSTITGDVCDRNTRNGILRRKLAYHLDHVHCLVSIELIPFHGYEDEVGSPDRDRHFLVPAPL